MGSLGTRSKEISQHVDEQMQQATQRLQEHPAWGGSLVSESERTGQDFGQELKQQAKKRLISSEAS